MKKILHISSNYGGSPLYKMLLIEQLALGLSLHMFIPERNLSFLHKHWIDHENLQISQPMVIKSYDRLLYFTKLFRGFKVLNAETDPLEIGLCHAHTLFTDGGIAYLLYKKYKIPYMVALRDTDINLFFKYALHLRPFGCKVLECASKIIFLSKVVCDLFFQKYVPRSKKEAMKKKCVVIPNGIDPDWFSDNVVPRSKPARPLRICYAARRFDKRKNPWVVVEVVRKLNAIGLLTELHMVGSGKAKNKLERNTFINMYDPITSIVEMKRFYDAADIFLLPSLTETFGLVYAEAMSRGLPVLYTKGQGFDGQFPDGEVGYPISAKDVSDIVGKIKLCIEDYELRSARSINGAKRYRWCEIAKQYKAIYQEISV